MKKLLCLSFSLLMLVSSSSIVLAADADQTADSEIESLLQLTTVPTLLDQEDVSYDSDDIAKGQVNNELKQKKLLYVNSAGHLVISPDAWTEVDNISVLTLLSDDYTFGNSAVNDGILAIDPNSLEFYSTQATKENLERIKQIEMTRTINNSFSENPSISPLATPHCSLKAVNFGSMVRANRTLLTNYYNNLMALKASNPRITPGYSTIQLWISKVQPNGPWDYKVVSGYAPYNKVLCLTYGINNVKKNYHRTSEFMGNYNYGFTGRQLFPLSILKVGSNAVAGNPFVKDVDDYPAIEEGYNDARS